MRILTIGVFAILISLRCFAGQNYIDYHKTIIKAESLFMNGKEKEAIALYKTAFDLYPKSFVKDAYIAAQIACKTKDTNSMHLFLKLAFQKGMDISVVENDSNLNALMTKIPDFSEKLKAEFKEGKKYFISTINLPLRYEITSMVNKDQLYHQMPSISKDPFNPLFRDVTATNMQRIVAITKQFGYPGEHLTGIINNELDNKSSVIWNNELEETVPIIFYHQACCFQLLKDELYKSVLNGDLHPRQYAIYYEWSFGDILTAGDTSENIMYAVDSNGNRGAKIPSHKIDNSANLNYCEYAKSPSKAYKICELMSIYIVFSAYDKNKINADRASIGIASLEHDELKKEFAKKHHLKLFFGYFGSR